MKNMELRKGYEPVVIKYISNKVKFIIGIFPNML